MRHPTSGLRPPQPDPEERHRIEAHHHQAIDRVGDGLVVTGWAVPDGTSEALERLGHPLALGVPWHPEADPASQVIGALVRAAVGSAQ